MRIPVFYVLAKRYNGNDVKLYESTSELLAKLYRLRKLNARRFAYIIITQGYVYKMFEYAKIGMWRIG